MPLSVQALECARPSGLNAPQAAQPAASLHDTAEPTPLVTLSRDTGSQHAVILLGGIYNDHHYFSPWWPCLAGGGRLLLGWHGPHHVRRLEASAQDLAAEMIGLHSRGVRQITLLAHSIGGLVAKGAVDRLTEENLARRFEKIELHAFGTPWGGFPSGDLARSNPLGILVSWVAGHPVWLDIGTGSPYLIHLARPMPANGQLYHYISAADTVAMPRSEAAVQRYDSFLQHAAAIVSLSGVDHNAYTLHRIDALMRSVDRRMLAVGSTSSSGSSD